MNNVVLYNPAIATSNIGDEIIFKYSKKALRDKFKTERFVELPTQTSVSKKILKRFADADCRFVCGSNLLQSNMFFKLCRKGIATHAIRQWDISLSEAKLHKNSVLLGCGWQNYNKDTNLYTKALWKKVLSDKYMHSVRDEFTKRQLEEIGISNVINTGCPTTWALTEEFCTEIPEKKAESVVTTITDYRRDLKNDEKMLEILISNYKDVHLWLQGSEDRQYFNTFNENIKKEIKLIESPLECYTEFLSDNDVDYVGTRLHGGIHAMNMKKRAVIVGIDNRAVEMKKDINLKVVDRDSVELIENEINSNWKTELHIPTNGIKMFLEQFI